MGHGALLPGPTPPTSNVSVRVWLLRDPRHFQIAVLSSLLVWGALAAAQGENPRRAEGRQPDSSGAARGGWAFSAA